MDWAPIPGFEGMYEIHPDGTVRNARTLRPLKPADNGKGYMKVAMWRNGKMVGGKIHRLLALAFIPNPDGLPLVRHLDDDKSNNDLSNLAWGTKEDNGRDAVENGRFPWALATHCKRGHEFTEENTYVYPRGVRSCRECMRENKRRYRANGGKR